MTHLYWLGRQRASLANAKSAAGAEARLIHYELAGRYGLNAANALLPASSASAGASTIEPTKLPARTNKAPRDTVAGCRSRAEADLLTSVSMPTANERHRMEASAASWTARADLLQVEDEKLVARVATANAHSLRIQLGMPVTEPPKPV